MINFQLYRQGGSHSAREQVNWKSPYLLTAIQQIFYLKIRQYKHSQQIIMSLSLSKQSSQNMGVSHANSRSRSKNEHAYLFNYHDRNTISFKDHNNRRVHTIDESRTHKKFAEQQKSNKKQDKKKGEIVQHKANQKLAIKEFRGHQESRRILGNGRRHSENAYRNTNSLESSQKKIKYRYSDSSREEKSELNHDCRKSQKEVIDRRSQKSVQPRVQEGEAKGRNLKNSKILTQIEQRDSNLQSIKRICNMQAEKNQRIRQIYNPTQKTAQISNIRSKGAKANLNTIKFRQRSLKQSIEVSRLEQEPQPIDNSNGKNEKEEAQPVLRSKVSGSGILPITYQKLEKLSTIAQKESVRPFTPSQHSTKQLPLPKFSKFFDSYTLTTKSQTLSYDKYNSTESARDEDINRTSCPEILKKRLRCTLKNFAKSGHVKKLSILEEVPKGEIEVLKEEDGVYYGQIDEFGAKSGKGVLFFHDGRVYQGDFKANLKDGVGTQAFPDESCYRGEFVAGQRNGKGRFEWPNGQVYDGQWKDNKKHGSGGWQGPEGSSYLGQWIQGVISGFGVMTNEKGERYEGEFLYFNKEGQGTYRFVNGEKIIGSFSRNQPNGQCEYFWPNGDYFKGSFVNGLRHGTGCIEYSNGGRYQGEFRNDKKCGFGEEHYLDGVFYIGNFENDLRHGYGKIQYGDTVYYEGYWLNNKAVVFHQGKEQAHEGPEPDPDMQAIKEDIDNQRLQSRISNKISQEKLGKLQTEEKKKIIQAIASREKIAKLKVQKFSSKNLLERLYNPRKRACKCGVKH